MSESVGHDSVAFALTRYGGLSEDDSHQKADRLDARCVLQMEDSGHGDPACVTPGQNWYPQRCPNGIRTSAAALKGIQRVRGLGPEYHRRHLPGTVAEDPIHQ